MLVELIGAPGSGKTTVAKWLDGHLDVSGLTHLSTPELARLDRACGDRSLERIRLPRRLARLAPLFWRHPSIATRICLLGILHGLFEKKRYRRTRRLLGHLLLLMRLQGDADRHVVILDDGFVQHLWSMLIESKELRSEALIGSVLADYCRIFEPVCIALTIEDEIASERVFARRSRGRFNRESDTARRGGFHRWLAYHRRLVALLPRGAIVATIDASQAPPAVAGRLAKVLRAQAGEAPSARTTEVPGCVDLGRAP